MTGATPKIRIIRPAVLALLMLAAVALAKPAYAFECPAAQPLTHPGVIREPAPQIAELETIFSTGDAANRIPVIIDDLSQITFAEVDPTNPQSGAGTVVPKGR